MFDRRGERLDPCGVPDGVAARDALLAHDPRGEEQSDQRQDALVGHPTAHLFHQETLMDRPETVLDVSLYHPLIRAGGVDEEPHLLDGVLGSASGPESVRGRAEVRLEDRLEHELGRRLHDPVAHRRRCPSF